MAQLMPSLSGLELRFRQGWDKQSTYAEALANSDVTDRDQGFTHVGRQRADIRVLIDVHLAAETLSRGQQKLVVSALKLAQGRLLEEMNGRTCVYLIDDLPAELDGEHRRLFCQLLAGLECQVFVTCVEPETLDRVWLPNTDVRMFHVEHGRLHTE